MNKTYLSTLVAGFAAGVLHAVPLVSSFTFCLIVPTAAYFSIILYQRANNDFSFVPVRMAIIFGLLTGIFAGLFGTFFEVMITLVTKTSPIVDRFPALMDMIDIVPVEDAAKEVAKNLFYIAKENITTTGFSLFYTLNILVSNVFTDIIFGVVGGLVGVQFLNKRNRG